MPILIVIATPVTGRAAHQAGTQVSFWIIGAVFMFLPVAAVVQYRVRIWPYEGGVYQWTKHAFGPFAGFLTAWNLGAWVLLLVASLPITGNNTTLGASDALESASDYRVASSLVIHPWIRSHPVSRR